MTRIGRCLRSGSCESAVTLTGWFPPLLSLSLEPQRTCVHALSSFQRTEVVRFFRAFPTVALATALFRGTFQSYPAYFSVVNIIIASWVDNFIAELRRPCRRTSEEAVERSRGLRPETTCRTVESYSLAEPLSTPSGAATLDFVQQCEAQRSTRITRRSRWPFRSTNMAPPSISASVTRFSVSVTRRSFTYRPPCLMSRMASPLD